MLQLCMPRKKINHQRFGEKNSYQNQINHTLPPQKRQIVGL